VHDTRVGSCTCAAPHPFCEPCGPADPDVPCRCAPPSTATGPAWPSLPGRALGATGRASGPAGLPCWHRAAPPPPLPRWRDARWRWPLPRCMHGCCMSPADRGAEGPPRRPGRPPHWLDCAAAGSGGRARGRAEAVICPTTRGAPATSPVWAFVIWWGYTPSVIPCLTGPPWRLLPPCPAAMSCIAAAGHAAHPLMSVRHAGHCGRLCCQAYANLTVPPTPPRCTPCIQPDAGRCPPCLRSRARDIAVVVSSVTHMS